MKLAVKGTTIESPEQAARAADFIRDLSAFLAYIEAGRTSAKAPVLEEGRRIDELAGQLTAGLPEQKKRINDMLGTYKESERRKEQEAREAAVEAERKARMEAAEKQRKIDEEAARVQREADARAAAEQAERDRLAREEQERLAAKAASAKSAKAREAAELAAKQAQEQAAIEAEAARLRKEQEDTARASAVAKAQEAVVDTATASIIAARCVPACVPKLAGVSVRTEIFFEVLDIVALYEAQPACVKMEPNKAVIKSLLTRMPDGQTLPGLKWTRQATSSVRG